MSRRAITLLGAETLLLCLTLPLCRWLGAGAGWLLVPWCVVSLALFAAVGTAPLLFGHARRAATGVLLFCLGSAAIGTASLALSALAYERHLLDTTSRLDRVVAAIESHRRSSGALPADLAGIATDGDVGLSSHELRRLHYRAWPEPAGFELSVPCPGPTPTFLSFGAFLVHRSQWEPQRIKGCRDLGRGWKLIEAD